MKNKIIYFACHNSSPEHPWYSSGRNSKVIQTLNILKKLSDNLVLVNFVSKEKIKSSLKQLIYAVLLINLYIAMRYYFLLSNKKVLSSKEKKILIVYNPTFTSLLFFISSNIFGSNNSLIIQVEDIPGARKASFKFLDKISFKILSIFSTHILFASEGMMNKFKFKNPKNVNLSVYPPYLDKRFIEIIKNRKTPLIINI